MPLLFPLIALLAGCPKPAGDVLRNVRFEGNDGAGLSAREWLLRPQTDASLRNAMAQPAAPNLFATAPPLDRGTLDEDAWRLEVWYANRGYFDARFLGWSLVPVRRSFVKRDAADRVRWVATGYIDEGEPSRIRTIDVRGVESLMAPTRARLRESLGIEVGDVWSTPEWTATLDGIRASLLDRSYAHVVVSGRVDAHPEEHAVDATIDVTPGPRCHFGAVSIVNTSPEPKVPEKVLRDIVTVKEGEPFDTKALAETRARLYALRVFGVVDVVPDVSDPTSTVVPVRIELRQSLARQLQLGPAFELDSSSRAAVFARAEWDDHNLGNKLVDSHQETRLGYAGLVNPVTAWPVEGFASASGPIASVDGDVSWPYVWGEKWALGAKGGFELGIEPGYRFWSAEGSPAATWKPRERLTITVGPRFRYYRYYDVTALPAFEDSPLGLDTREKYFLALFEQRAVYDGRNDALSPTRGWYWSLGLSEAGLVGDYQYVGTQGEARTYRSLRRFLWWEEPGTVVAGRLGGGILWPFGSADVANVPIAERLYLGGGTSVRGWGADSLGPYVENVTSCGTNLSGGEQCVGERLPVGGELSLFGNFEVRQPVFADLGVVGFVDAGRVWNTPRRFDLAQIQWSVGGGIRYATPIGPVRVDVGARLGDPAYFADTALTKGEPRVTVHLGLSEAF